MTGKSGQPSAEWQSCTQHGPVAGLLLAISKQQQQQQQQQSTSDLVMWQAERQLLLQHSQHGPVAGLLPASSTQQQQQGVE
jgi:hypothetical protein